MQVYTGEFCLRGSNVHSIGYLCNILHLVYSIFYFLLLLAIYLFGWSIYPYFISVFVFICLFDFLSFIYEGPWELTTNPKPEHRMSSLLPHFGGRSSCRPLTNPVKITLTFYGRSMVFDGKCAFILRVIDIEMG